MPTSSHLNVTLDNDEAGPVHLSIVDMQGRVVKQWVVNKAAEMMVQPLDISELSPGAYTLLARGGKTLARGRFVKL